MRQKCLVSEGLPRSLQRADTGRLAGQLRIYCVLNQDAARLARRGFTLDALKLVKRAQVIERSRDARLVVDAIARHVSVASSNYDDAMGAALANAATDDVVRAALLRVTERVEDTRLASKALETIQRLAVGRVTKIHGDLADVLLEHGRAIVLDEDTLAPNNLFRLGAAVALHWERWGNGQAFLETEPGVDLDGDPVDLLQSRFAFLRPPPVGDELWDVAATVSGALTVQGDVVISRGN